MTVILFNENKNAIGLSTDEYQGPMIYAPAPGDFDANNWINYVLSNNEVVLAASTESLEQSCQFYLDNFAKTRGYNTILSACSYANSSNSVYQIEGTYALQARDETWSTLYNIINESAEHVRPAIKTFDEIIPDLPVLKWPDEIVQVANT